MIEARFALVGTTIVVAGFLAVVIDGADSFRVAAAVAALISLLAGAFRPPSEESFRWRLYLSAVTFLGLLIVLSFFVLPHFLLIERPKSPPTTKSCPTQTATPIRKPKMEGKK